MVVDARWADSVHRVGLMCRQCGDIQLHELRYAGRLLAASTCLTCRATVKHDDADLRRAYLRDLERRIRSKPGRMMRRAARHPAKFISQLPHAILVKPAKMLEEAKPLLGCRLGASGH